MFCIPYWMVSMPPLFSNVKRIRMAPKTMMRTPMAVTMPCNVRAATYPGLNPPEPRMPLTAQQTTRERHRFRCGPSHADHKDERHQMGRTATIASSSTDIMTPFLPWTELRKKKKKPSPKSYPIVCGVFPVSASIVDCLIEESQIVCHIKKKNCASYYGRLCRKKY